MFVLYIVLGIGVAFLIWATYKFAARRTAFKIDDAWFDGQEAWRTGKLHFTNDDGLYGCWYQRGYFAAKDASERYSK